MRTINVLLICYFLALYGCSSLGTSVNKKTEPIIILSTKLQVKYIEGGKLIKEVDYGSNAVMGPNIKIIGFPDIGKKITIHDRFAYYIPIATMLPPGKYNIEEIETGWSDITINPNLHFIIKRYGGIIYLGRIQITLIFEDHTIKKNVEIIDSFDSDIKDRFEVMEVSWPRIHPNRPGLKYVKLNIPNKTLVEKDVLARAGE